MQSSSYYYLEDFIKKIGEIENDLQEILDDKVELSRDFSAKVLFKRLDMMKAFYEGFLKIEKDKECMLLK